jgi:arylsulfatase A-like enzyme
MKNKYKITLVICLIAIIIFSAYIFIKYLNKSPQEKKLENIQSHKEDLNIILISIDTLRADHLSAYGYDIETPNIDRLSQEGTTFLNCRTPVPMTLPGHASMLIGKNPPGHGVHVNMKLLADEGNTFLSEILQENGYQTSAFIASTILDREFGFNQGFDYYGDKGYKKQINPSNKYKKADEIKDEVLDWFNNHCKDRFFAFIHFYDPHYPYEPPEPFKSQYPDSPYDGEIAYTDKVIGEMLGELEEMGFLENTLVILTADHWESLGERGIEGHSYFLYNNELWVPAIFWCPQLILQGKRIEEQIRLIDIVPTVLDILDYEIPEDVEGESLVDYIIRDKKFKGFTCYSETLRNYTNFGWAKLFAVEKGDWKYIFSPEPELYNIKKDPYEEKNVYDENPEIVLKMDSILEDILIESSATSNISSEEVAMDEETRKHLMSLGYVSGGTGVFKGNEDINPKDHIETIMLFENVVRNFGTKGKEKFVEDSLVKLVELESDVPVFYPMLKEHFISTNRINIGISRLDKIVKKNPENLNARNILANLYIRNKEFLMAERIVDEILEIESDNELVLAEAYYIKGQLYNDYHKDYREALDYLNKSIKINPNLNRDVFYYAFMISYYNLGDYKLARKYGEQHLKIYPSGNHSETIKSLMKNIPENIN